MNIFPEAWLSGSFFGTIMSLLNSEQLLDLLMGQGLLSKEQRQFVILQKGKQRQKLLKRHGGRRQGDMCKLDRGYPDLVDIVVSLQLESPAKKVRC